MLSGDTRVSEKVIRYAEGVDVLVHEVFAPETLQRAGVPPERAKNIVDYHTTAEQAGQVFTRTKPKLAVYSHICMPTAAEAEPVDDEHGAVLAFIADGESWSTSALALALGTSQRSVQRALDSLATAGKVQSLGRGRARRWTAPPLPGFTTTLLLPAPLPSD